MGLERRLSDNDGMHSRLDNPWVHPVYFWLLSYSCRSGRERQDSGEEVNHQPV
jgi:hypothetical protein